MDWDALLVQQTLISAIIHVSLVRPGRLIPVEIQTLLVPYVPQYAVLADQMDPARVVKQTSTSPKQRVCLAQEIQSHLQDQQEFSAHRALQPVLHVTLTVVSLAQPIPS
jgi:hypothetical protein